MPSINKHRLTWRWLALGNLTQSRNVELETWNAELQKTIVDSKQQHAELQMQNAKTQQTSEDLQKQVVMLQKQNTELQKKRNKMTNLRAKQLSEALL